MKNFCISLFLIAIIIVTIAVGVQTPSTSNTEYLRIHIRANSNSEEDQLVKMTVKDGVVNYLTPIISQCKTKNEAVNALNIQKENLQKVINDILKSNGFNYLSNVKIANEEFPLRVYENVTLEEGFYDAVIVELGKAEGDNWWCVMYPPLCFYGETENVKYKFKLKEIIDAFFNKNSDESN